MPRPELVTRSERLVAALAIAVAASGVLVAWPSAQRTAAAAEAAGWRWGPAQQVARAHGTVIGHRDDAALLRDVADLLEAAVPTVSAVWGRDWTQRVVVLVPRDAELAQLPEATGDLRQLAALERSRDGVIVLGPAFRSLGPAGRRVVLTHEVVHVATERFSTRAPSWLVEGLADYVGYRDGRVPIRQRARELAALVRSGAMPGVLPSDAEFAGPEAPAAYEGAEAAARLVALRAGESGLVRLYRLVGDGRPVGAALRDVIGLDEAAFVAAWRAQLRAELQ